MRNRKTILMVAIGCFFLIFASQMVVNAAIGTTVRLTIPYIGGCG